MAAEKLYEYQGFQGRLHTFRDDLKERWANWKEENPGGLFGKIKEHFSTCERGNDLIYEDYSHIYRHKTRRELIRISAAVMGIEFSYAAETAFVSPTLLKIGVEHKHMTLVWALSPLIGFFLTPILGSLSDRCPVKFGRRRPFIFAMSLGVLFGLILVPNGESLGYALGDTRPLNANVIDTVSAHRISSLTVSNPSLNSTMEDQQLQVPSNSHPWGIFFTVLGTVLLDFDADACQSPSRAYLLDITIPDDHAKGLSTFTIMAGLGGFFGYALGGINWDVTFIGSLLGGHVRAVFTLITVIFIVCVSYTITSFKEMPLPVLELRGALEDDFDHHDDRECNAIATDDQINYGAVETTDRRISTNSSGLGDEDGDRFRKEMIREQRKSIAPSPDASLMVYLKSIVYMPYSIRMVCLTNLFCWMAHVCYSLYFTDFVGEAVFQGNPTALDGDPERELYESGVRFGCWGMSMYSLSCACYSMVIERMIKRFGAKPVYIGGLLVYSAGMFLMAVTKHKVGVILFSWTAGVMYSTLFTMPYLLVAHYHAKQTFAITDKGVAKIGDQIRGLGTDVALVSSMVFLAQFILSMCMGTIVSVSGTTTAVVSVASTLAFFGSIAASQVMYLDL